MGRIRITNERLNSYGTRVLTAGMDIEQYQRNPVLLYMHRRGDVIGMVKDIKVEGDEITGELCFDEATDLSRQAKKQYEFGSLRMVSVGIDIIEMSDEPALLVQGQTSPTITRSKLFEVSLVDIGSNDDAITLRKDGKILTLAGGGENTLPTLNKKQVSFMDNKKLALLLGLPETATEAEIQAKLNQMLAEHQELETLRTESEQMRLAAITAAVDSAISERRLTTDKKEQFITLGKKVGIDDLKATLAAMVPAAKVSSVISPESGQVSFKKLSEVPADQIESLRENDKATYRKLYRAEYGIDCEI